MMAPFRVAGHYGDVSGASTSKTKKKVPERPNFLSFIAAITGDVEISVKSMRTVCAFLPIHATKGAVVVRKRAEM